jgi:hypothetical protein
MKIQHQAATYLLILLCLASCTSDPYAYDRYDQNTPPSRQGSQMNQGGMGGNPYQQNPYGQPNYQRQPYQQNPYGQPQYQQNPYQQNPYQQNPYGQPQQYNNYQMQPNSRLYSNPYANPPSQYLNGYDADQYYVPPAGYGVERNDVSGLNPTNMLR